MLKLFFCKKNPILKKFKKHFKGVLDYIYNSENGFNPEKQSNL